MRIKHYFLFLVFCLANLIISTPTFSQSWLVPHANLQFDSKPNPTSFEDLIGANAGKEIGQNRTSFKATGVIKNLRSFHIMGSDYGNGFFPNEQTILPYPCDCGDEFYQCASQTCRDEESERVKAFGFRNWKAHYCDWKKGYEMEYIQASLEAIFPKLGSVCEFDENFNCIQVPHPCTKYGFGRNYPNKWYTQEEWGGSFDNIRRIAATYAENFAATFCPDDTRKQCLVNVLEVGNEPWGRGDDKKVDTPDDTPGKEGYKAICWGVIDGLTTHYNSSNPKDWRMKLSTAAFEAYTTTPGCGDDPNQYIEVMVPNDFQNGKSLRSYFDFVSVHNYAFPQATLCQDQNLRKIPESSDGLFLALKNMKKWMDTKMPQAKLNITEFGWNSRSAPGCYAVGQANQAAYLIRAFLLVARYDVYKAFAYAFYDHEEEPLFCSVGLQVEHTHEEKKALKAIRKMNQIFGTKHFIKVIKEQADEGEFAYLIGDFDAVSKKGKPTHLVTWRAKDLMKKDTFDTYPELDNNFTTFDLGELSADDNSQYTYLGWDNTKDGHVGDNIVRTNENSLSIRLSGMPLVIPLNAHEYTYDDEGNLSTNNEEVVSNPPSSSKQQVSCGELMITYGNGTIEIKGKPNTNYKKMEVINITGGKYAVTQLCVNNCGTTQTIIDLPQGNYLVKVFGSSWQQVCLTQYHNPIRLEEKTTEEENNNLPPSCPDDDNDGFCNDEDCAPYDANFPKPAGIICDDGQTNTINDKIQTDGCTCKGDINNENTNLKTVSCGEINIQYGNGQIIMSGVTGRAYRFSIQDVNRGWKEVFSCWSGCGSYKKVSDLPASKYSVKVYGGVNPCSQFIQLRSAARSRAVSSEILELATQVQQQTIQLEWIVGQVDQTDKFVIEKSMDGVSFKPIHEVTTLFDYHFKESDIAPDYGTNYYRIKQIFMDGNFRYSTVSSEQYFIDESSITLFPNPAKETLQLSIGHFTPLEGTVHIFNRVGIEVSNSKLNTDQQNLHFDTRTFPNGLYYLIIEAKGKKTITRPFMVENGL